jgi:ABC-type transporter Mla subunit MlaD
VIEGHRDQLAEVVANVNQLVASLSERDRGVEKTFDGVERRLNRHRVAFDRLEERVSRAAFGTYDFR